ncbi:MAG TPA: YdcF family protein [Candidatus Limiplasma sp.]|nr:YdcF family protein [Candidatus Limiplasma sp.]HRX08316.1 YdcF family protein [Candidatus Limiplasma sp.]
MNKTLRGILKLLVILAVIGLVFYIGLIGYTVYREKNVPEPSDYDVIVVLGAQVLPNGDPSVQLDWRLNKAVEMYMASPSPVITCGAQGSDEPRPEADVMRDLLIARGVPAELVYTDSVSFDTYQNIRNAKVIIEGLGLSKPLIITSDYHLPRAMDIAKAEGFAPQGVPSPTRQEINFWLKNHGREALAWVKFFLIRYMGLSL